MKKHVTRRLRLRESQNDFIKLIIEGTPVKILIVDDSSFSRTQMKHLLKQLDLGEDIEILEADGAVKGNLLFDQEAPDLVLTDLVMPEVQGDAVVKHVRSQSQTCFISVVSANVQERVQSAMVELGADYFLEKPFNIKKLLALFEAYNNKRDSQR